MELDLNSEIKALRLVFLRDIASAPPSPNQLAALNSLLGSGLSDHRRALRLAILREITGLPIQSTRELTAGTVSTLITYMKANVQGDWDLNEKAKEVIAQLERCCMEKLPAAKARKRGLEKRTTEDVLDQLDDSSHSDSGWLADSDRSGDNPQTQCAEKPADDQAGKSYIDAWVEAAMSRVRDAHLQRSGYARSVVDQG
jgi:hypothetical protein